MKSSSDWATPSFGPIFWEIGRVLVGWGGRIGIPYGIFIGIIHTAMPCGWFFVTCFPLIPNLFIGAIGGGILGLLLGGIGAAVLTLMVQRHLVAWLTATVPPPAIRWIVVSLVSLLLIVEPAGLLAITHDIAIGALIVGSIHPSGIGILSFWPWIIMGGVIVWQWSAIDTAIPDASMPNMAVPHATRPSRGRGFTMIGIPFAFFLVTRTYGLRMVMIDSLIFYSVVFALQAPQIDRRVGRLGWVLSSLGAVFVGHLIAQPLFNRGLGMFLRQLVLPNDPYATNATLLCEGVYGGILGIVVGLLQCRMVAPAITRWRWLLSTVIAFGGGYALQYWVVR